MSWYELLLTLHILGAGLYLGSLVAITVLGHRTLATDPPAYGPYMGLAGWWASKAHPAAAVVILVAGILMVIDADLSFGDAWISIGLGGWLALGIIGGGVVGAAANKLGEPGSDAGALATRILLWSRIEAAILIAIIAVMVTKPGA